MDNNQGFPYLEFGPTMKDSRSVFLEFLSSAKIAFYILKRAASLKPSSLSGKKMDRHPIANQVNWRGGKAARVLLELRARYNFTRPQ